MDERQVQDLILNGSLDAFLDALDFAPQGVIDLIKDYAVSMPMNDVEKRQALLKKTGFDVDKALLNIRPEQEEVEEKKEAPTRRVVESTPQRRSSAEYKLGTDEK
jgi:hypothetical protein